MANSFVKRSSYRITSDDDIMKIPDVKTAMILLKAWGLNTKGLRTKDQALQRLLDHWQSSSEEQEKRSAEKINTYETESSEKLRQNTNKLAAKFDSMVKFFKQLSIHHQRSICDSYSNFEEIAVGKIQNMKKRESALIIGGEIGSGQTSLINLLLKTDILPVDEAGCTKTYCELKQGSIPRAKLYKRTLQTKESIVVDLDLDKSADKDNLCKFITSSQSDDGRTIHEKVLIEYPFQFLENGIYVLDIPDTIDTSLRLEDIISELPSCVVALYVLDISNPENMRTSKLVEFIQYLSNTSKHKFKVDDLIVVCNKCDVISEDKLEGAKKLAKDQIMSSCQELTEEQITFMSVKEEHSIDTSGVHTEEFQNICKKVHDIFLRKLENNLVEEYRWLSKVHKRALYILKVSKLNSNKTIEEHREMMVQLQQRIEKLETESRIVLARLHDEIEMEIDKLYGKLSGYFSSDELKSSMTIWLEDQCPKPEKKWKNLKCTAENYICDKLRAKVREWEQVTSIKTGIKQRIISKFGQEVELMEDQINAIAEMLACGDSSAVANLHKSFRQDNAALKTSPPRQFSNPTQKDKNKLSDLVCSIGGFNKAVKKDIRPIFKKYKKDNCTRQMFKATDIYINCLLKNPQLKDMVAKYVKRFSKDINKIAKMVPDLIAMDKRLMTTLEAEIMENKETMFVIPEHLRRCLVLQGELDMFYIYEMLQLDYHLRDLEWSEKKKLGTGTFAVVHPGMLKTGNGEKTEVAIKVFKDPLKVNTVSELLLEDETLRELDHENIIKYYGATIMQKGTPTKTYWIMIMASCLTNLKDVYLDKTSALKETNPGSTAAVSPEHEKAKNSMSRYAIQICSGIQYLHNKKLVHRDLKQENILVTKDRTIKLTDVGLTKQEEDISGTFVGSPVYMAPEVHEQKTIYNIKADIYSLSMVLWEMWYGETINDELDNHVRGRLSVEIRRGTRPSFRTDNFTKPPDTWVDLFEHCWHKNPKFRPKASKIAEFFQNELDKNTVYFV